MTNQTLDRKAQISLAKEYIKEQEAQTALSKLVELLKDANPNWDWVGIYLLNGDTLNLGPYAGESTEHTHIKVGRGVCGVAVESQANQIIEDVSKLDNYIACSIHTKSEIVVLIKEGGKILGQFDLDSDTANAFNKEDEDFLTELAQIASPAVKKLLNA